MLAQTLNPFTYLVMYLFIKREPPISILDDTPDLVKLIDDIPELYKELERIAIYGWPDIYYEIYKNYMR